MRRPLLLPALAVLALAVAACGSSTGPGWTFAPPTVPPPSQAVPSGEASAAPSAAPSGASGAVQLSALNVSFEQASISAPANADFVIHFDNKDAGIAHNVQIRDASGMDMFKGDLVTGPAATDYQVKALAAGTYTFICIVHPNMTGTLKVGG